MKIPRRSILWSMLAAVGAMFMPAQVKASRLMRDEKDRGDSLPPRWFMIRATDGEAAKNHPVVPRLQSVWPNGQVCEAIHVDECWSTRHGQPRNFVVTLDWSTLS